MPQKTPLSSNIRNNRGAMPPGNSDNPDKQFVSRAGFKLKTALDTFGIDPRGLACADLGCNTGGFTDCLLQSGAKRVFAVDTGYGALAWSLRQDERVVVMERTNALHVEISEPVDLVTIDVAWTRQHHILPAAGRLLHPQGTIISLIKPHYEAYKKQLRKGVLPADALPEVLETTLSRIKSLGFAILGSTSSPIQGRKGNVEHLLHLKPCKSHS